MTVPQNYGEDTEEVRRKQGLGIVDWQLNNRDKTFER